MASPADYPQIRRALLAWYRAHRRDLPWRRSRDPYAIWISEIMLQQTRVEAVIPYYKRFMSRFPGVSELARAREEDVLAAWSGLGYYRRARHLHAAAKEMRVRYEGKFPQDEEAIRNLPGVGPYTAGALLSIAFEKRAAILDGNVIRLLTRLFAISGDPAESAIRRKLWALAEDILPKANARDFNQALMELPALVCTPRSPRCGECPLRSLCQAHARGEEGKFPQKSPKATPRAVSVSYACVEKDEKFLLRRRDEDPLKGFWEFPRFGSEGLSARSRWLPLGEAKHAIMDSRITARFFLAKASAKMRGITGKWFSAAQIESGPVTTLTKKGLNLYKSKKMSMVLPGLTEAVFDCTPPSTSTS